MKKFIALVIFLALAVIFLPWLQPRVNAAPGHKAVFLVDQEVFIVDGQARAMDAASFTQNDRAYVPMRFLVNALGIPDGDITWDGESQSVTITADPTVRLTVGSPALYVNNKELDMDVAPLLMGDRVFLPARWVAEALGYQVKWDGAAREVLVGPPGDLPGPQSVTGELPVVGTYENLKNLLAETQDQNGILYGAKSFAAPQGAARDPVAAGSAGPAGAGAADYSGTNVQVEGVDEADIVKTDGSYIYQVSGARVVISRAYPAAEMKIVSTLDFAQKDFSPQEMYVDDKYLVVIGQTPGRGVVRPLVQGDARVMPSFYLQDSVKAIVFDISDKSNVSQVRELELQGRYVSSRKIGRSFYLVANESIHYYPLTEDADLRPSYRDTAAGGDFMPVDYSEIRCFPGFVMPNYLIVAGINLDSSGEKAQVDTYLGAGENIYASTANLYVAATNYQSGLVEGKTGLLPETRPVNRNRTKIYKFAMSGGKLTYTSSGEVPGAILNQFSMDERNGYLRIATTKGDVWQKGEGTSKNNIYVLDSGLNVTGKVEDIAPGEKIYSVRFVGDRGYMVTFKTVDPFFVIDLKDPQQPAILGALKLPGYSDYLHPYDENHIIGFGKDTLELGQKDGNGNDTGSMAFYTGMKMAIFDVSDVSNPVEMFHEEIGDRGTDSELLHNHKALLFSREKNLLAFPVKVAVVQGSAVKSGESFPEYGEFAFQGAYVYSVDLTNGFALKGKITHLSLMDYLKAGDYWYDSDKNIKRILYINDTLYTLSNQYIKANDLENLKEINTLKIN